MKTPTIYDIKYSITNESHYFDRKSMRFFGQTLKDFCVKKSPTNRIFIYAPMYHDKKFAHAYSFREFADNKLINTDIQSKNTLDEILDYIKAH